MEKKVRDHLNEKADELLLFKTKPNLSIVEEALSMNVGDLETIRDDVLSKYIIVLSQYLIFFNSQMNKSKVMYMVHSKNFDKVLNSAIIDIKGKSVGERKAKAVEDSSELLDLEDRVSHYEREVNLGKDHDTQVTTLINALKRELTRREHENQLIRKERRG